MGEAQSILKLETACPQAVRLLFLLLILILLMILPERVDAQGKIRSKIKSMSKIVSLHENVLETIYFFGSAMACAATHCHSPFRSTQVSVKR